MVSGIVEGRVARGLLAGTFADALSYPFEAPAGRLRTLESLLEASRPAAALAGAVAALAEATPLAELQEEYTRTFDLDTMSRSEPTCYPYVGHYLFEENHKRGAFILGLKKRFRALGFDDESGDLPDHLVVLLRFLSAHDGEPLADELVEDAILPALARMLLAAGEPAADDMSVRAGYLRLLQALAIALAPDGATPDLVALETEREWARDRDSLGISRDWCGI